MQPDLQGLEVSQGELKHLIGIEPTEVFRPTILRNKKERLSFLLQELILSLALTPIIVGLLQVFIILPLMGASLTATVVIIIVVPITIIAVRWFWLQSKSPTALCNLLDEVERYNSVIQAMHIKDQLELTGTNQVSQSDRSKTNRYKVIEALTLIREDLVKALRTERVLRENQTFLAHNPELLVTNLSRLQTLKINDQASEYGRILSEALQIATEVQAEMTKLERKG